MKVKTTKCDAHLLQLIKLIFSMAFYWFEGGSLYLEIVWAENKLIVTDSIIVKKCTSQIGELKRIQFWINIIFSKILFSNYEQKAKADLNSWSGSHKPDTLTTELQQTGSHKQLNKTFKSSCSDLLS